VEIEIADSPPHQSSEKSANKEDKIDKYNNGESKSVEGDWCGGKVMVVGAGVPLFLAVKKAAEAGLAGLESLAGIPGTVGGATANNAGAYGKSISDILTKAEILTVGHSATYGTEVARNVVNAERSTTVVDKSWFEYEYRASRLKYWSGEDKPVILRVWFALKKSEPDLLDQKISEVMAARNVKEPKGFSAGCAFKNIKGAEVGELLEKINFSPEEKNLFVSREAIPAAWFIERAELKGKKIGGAYIPAEHANYILSDGTAKAEDVIMMISFIKQQVRDKFGVQLEEEIEAVI
jgi:UDP-N-acetylmuramate dehydrogenase